VKVLLLNTYAHGGAGIAARRLQSALNESGVQADLLTTQDVGGNWSFYAERLSFLPFERDKSVRFSFSLANFGKNILNHPRVQAADVLHLHWINQGFLSLQAIRELASLGKPLVWTLHDMWAFTGGCHYSGGCSHFQNECGHCPYLSRPGIGDLSHRIWMRKKRLLPPNLQYITCSEWLANTARSSGLLQQANITAIPNPIDTSLFEPRDGNAKRDLLKKWGLPTDRKIVLFSAMKVTDERKGYVYFLEAMRLIKQKHPELKPFLLVLGSMPMEEIEQWPFEGRATGMISDAAQLSEIYALSDAFVIPSLEDNLPNTVMESLACGTPVVGFDTGGIPEMVLHGEEGFIVAQRDSAGLAEQVSILLREDDLRKKMGLSARERVQKHYSNAVIAGRYIEVYKRLIG
jgi:glycosyltransferase involved in cell wall biosynthesis